MLKAEHGQATESIRPDQDLKPRPVNPQQEKGLENRLLTKENIFHI